MANRFWVGGTASWDATAGTKWAVTSGGAGGQTVPGAADDVFFNAASGAVTCTISTGAAARSVNCTGFTGTLTGTQGLNLNGGGLFLATAMTYTHTGTWTFSASQGVSLVTAGKTLAGVTVNKAGGTITLGSALTVSGTLNLIAGTIGSGFSISTGIFVSVGSVTRSCSQTIALTSTTPDAVVLQMSTVTGFTGTPTFTRNQAATATMTFGPTGGSTTNAPNLTVNAGASALTISTNSFFKNLNFTGSTCAVSGSVNMGGNLTLASGGTYTSLNPTFLVSTTFSSIGKTLGGFGVNGAGITVTLASALTIGGTGLTLTQGTINLDGFTLSTNQLNSSNSNVRSINFGLGGSITITTGFGGNLVLMSNATNFTRTGTGGINLPGTLSTGNYTFGSTGATSTNVLDVTISISSGGSQLTFTFGTAVRSINCTSGLCQLISQTTTTLFGNLTLASGGIYTTFAPTFANSATVTSNGRTLGNTTINGAGITVTLADAMSSSGTLTLTQGTFTTANFTVAASIFLSNNSNTRTLNMGSSTWNISGTTPAWNITTSTGMTLNAGTSTINMIASVGKLFDGGGLTYHNLNQGGTGQLNITGSNTFNDITNTVQPALVRFTAGTTQTVSNFSLSGTNAASRITINSVTPGVQFNLSKSSGAVNSQFLSIQDSNGTGGAVWTALNSVNVSNNSGWIFPGSNMFMMFI